MAGIGDEGIDNIRKYGSRVAKDIIEKKLTSGISDEKFSKLKQSWESGDKDKAKYADYKITDYIDEKHRRIK